MQMEDGKDLSLGIYQHTCGLVCSPHHVAGHFVNISWI